MDLLALTPGSPVDCNGKAAINYWVSHISSLDLRNLISKLLPFTVGVCFYRSLSANPFGGIMSKSVKGIRCDLLDYVGMIIIQYLFSPQTAPKDPYYPPCGSD
jgi:hypothetical protein